MRVSEAHMTTGACCEEPDANTMRRATRAQPIVRVRKNHVILTPGFRREARSTIMLCCALRAHTGASEAHVTN